MMQHSNRITFGDIHAAGSHVDLDHTLRGLAQVTDETAVDPHLLCPNDPLLGAFRLVAGDTRWFSPRGLSKFDGDPLAKASEHFRRIARSSHHRIRQIRLDRDWWRHMDGPLVALRLDGSPLALLPTSPGKYCAVDPSTGATRRMTSTLATELSTHVFEVTRPLPSGNLNIWQILRIGLARCLRELIVLALVALASGVLAIVMPLGMGMVIQTLIPDAYRGELMAVGVGLATAAVASASLRVAGEIATARIQTRLANASLPAVWDRLLSLPTSVFRCFCAGDLSIRVWGIHQIQQVAVSTIGTGMFLILPGLFNLVVMFWLGWQIAAWTLLIFLIVGIVTGFTCRMELNRRRVIVAMEGALNSQVLEMLSGIAKLKAAFAQTRAHNRWAVAFAKVKKAIFRAQRIMTFFTVFASAVPTLGRLAVFALFLKKFAPNMTLGNFVSFNTAFGIVTAAALSAAGSAITLTRIIPLADRVRPLLDAVPEIAHELPATQDLTGAIELKHLSFRYNPHSPLALDDVNLSIMPGEFVAVVGLSGSGKSTLLRVLLGLDQPQTGSVLFDQQDIRLLDLPTLRQQIGTVVQNGKLLAGSILQIVSGQQSLTPEHVMSLLEQVGFGPDVHAMPMGIHTFINDGGSSLSGGQRQQLLLARALAAKPKILLLDEATSALDNLSQAKVSRAIEQTKVARIVIAHRMSTVRNADRIVVMDHGRIVQAGKFEHLARQPGRFRELMERQCL